MPRCLVCGNDSSLASSLTGREAATANPPACSLVANFDEEGRITTMECQGASLDEAQAVYENPPAYLNTCPVCGSDNIQW